MNSKKTFITLFLALATMTSLVVTASAETEDVNNNTDTNTEISSQVTRDNLDAPITGMHFAKDDDNEVEMNQILLPGVEYSFPVIVTTEDGTKARLTEEIAEELRMSIREDENANNISDIELVESKGSYNLEFTTKKSWPTAEQVSEFSIRLADKRTGKKIYEHDIEIKSGYKEVSQDIIEEVGDGGYVNVEGTEVVVSEKQMEKLDSLSGSEEVRFTNDSWMFDVRVTGQGAVNMLNSEIPNKVISNKFEDNEFKFINFPGGPTFEFTGKLTIDMYNEVDDFEDFYVYRYYKGKLTKIEAEFDEKEELLSFNTNKLGNFVITDKEITDGTIVEEGFAPNGGSSSNNNNSNTGNENSSTDKDSDSSVDTGKDKEDNSSNIESESVTSSGNKVSPNTGAVGVGMATITALLSGGYIAKRFKK